MKRYLIPAGVVAVALAVSGCADNRALRGAALGGAGGAVVGAVVPGVSAVEGAAIGAAGGAIIGAITRDGQRHDLYRDERGNEYWIDRDGRRVYR